MNTNNFYWPQDLWSLHIEAQNNSDIQQRVEYARILNGNYAIAEIEKFFILKPGDAFRFVISRSHSNESGVCINFEENLDIRVFRLLDRAHFPTEAIMYYRGGKDKGGEYVKDK